MPAEIERRVGSKPLVNNTCWYQLATAHVHATKDAPIPWHTRFARVAKSLAPATVHVPDLEVAPPAPLQPVEGDLTVRAQARGVRVIDLPPCVPQVFRLRRRREPG